MRRRSQARNEIGPEPPARVVEVSFMMVAIFTAMVVALIAARWGPGWLAMAALLVCLALSTGEFLYEIDSPVDGFRLPWLQAFVQGGRPA